MTDVFNWLQQSHPSYQDGIALLEKYKPLSYLVDLCKARASKHNYNSLKSELQKLYDKNTAETPSSEKTELSVPEQLERILKTEFKRLNHIFMVNLRSSDEREREEAAEQILKGFDKVIHPIQRDLKYFKINKKLPDVHYLTVTVDRKITPADIKQQILNLRTNISKQKNKPNRQADVQKWMLQKAELEKQLDAIQIG